MGTGILAVAAALSPVKLPLLWGLGVTLWAGTIVLFGSVLTLWLVHLFRHPERVRACLSDRATAHFWGAPPIACFTVALGLLVFAPPLVGSAHSLVAAQGLWLVGVAGSLLAALMVPYMMFTRHELSTEMTVGTWLLPVVAPLVASVPGALLVPYWPLGWRVSLLAVNYGLWGTGTVLAALVVVLLYGRLTYDKVPVGAQVTTLWIVLGPLGASIAGLLALGMAASVVLPSIGPEVQVLGLVYGLPAWGFAMYWLTLSILITLRACQARFPFTLGWWSFTFPVGVLITGTYALYGRTHAPLFAGTGVLLLLLLAMLWILVALQTVRQSLRTAREALQVVQVPPIPEVPQQPRRDPGR
jgi:C4-dicarboxylate transporter/malic acid transport protein